MEAVLQLMGEAGPGSPVDVDVNGSAVPTDRRAAVATSVSGVLSVIIVYFILTYFAALMVFRVLGFGLLDANDSALVRRVVALLPYLVVTSFAALATRRSAATDWRGITLAAIGPALAGCALVMLSAAEISMVTEGAAHVSSSQLASSLFAAVAAASIGAVATGAWQRRPHGSTATHNKLPA